ncbi:MAG: aspartate/glutamate racemase family protein [Symploca sp. SIO1B1]|nr:aspartate/glutamate racemase family protein [Symploca sp. SIO1B1]
MGQQQLLYSRQLNKTVSWKKFSELPLIYSAIADYIEQLKLTAQYQAVRGRCVEDQDHPIEVWSFLPPSPSQRPIVLMGGMGPFAGIVGLDLACQYFGNKREIVLYQACSIPSRMTVMQAPHRLIDGFPLNQYLVQQVSRAIAQATEYLQSDAADIIIILLCNAVHYFLPQIKADLQKSYPKVAASVQYISLIEAVIANLEKQKLHQPLLLGTSATKIGKVYSAPLNKHGIKYQQLSEVAQEILMNIIYQGVKAFDQNYACLKGEELFHLLLNSDLAMAGNFSLPRNNLHIDCVIAGCTEIPVLLDWLLAQSQSSSIQSFLTQVKVINPVLSAFQEISSNG